MPEKTASARMRRIGSVNVVVISASVFGPAAAAPTLIGAGVGLQSDAKVEGTDNAWGWNVGVLWQATPQTRVGAAYRSSIKYDVDGTVNFNNPTAVGALPPTLAPVGVAILNGVNARLFDGGARRSI